MSTPSTPTSRGIARFLPAGRAWWLVGGAILAGLLLFALVLSGKRDEFEFYRADGEAGTGVPGQIFEPLPAPLPAGESAASGMDTDAPADGDAPRVDQHGTPPVETAVQPAAPMPPSPAPAELAGTREPRVLSAPPPEYPLAALRAGASGEVVLQIEVRADGRPGKVEVLSGTRNRALDRAAVRAVRQWRFEPAMRDGAAVAGSVQQTIRFDAPR
ncbi:energy transducer TonB [Luteimonas sp. SDU101]|uniref:energy transducer TonB n=1 Tax=unclassified Luteimonas TaxID=2629088 RepID=UPI003EB8DC30